MAMTFELHDFIDDQNFDQFIDLIQGENEILEPSFGCTFVSECIVDNQIGSTGEDMFGFNGQVHWCLILLLFTTHRCQV